MKHEKGFIALISAIILSVLLLGLTVSLGFSSFFTRFNILDSESKERSLALAEACGDTAVLRMARGVTVPGTVAIGTDSCEIISVSGNIIRTQACVNRATTNLEIIINGDFEIVTEEELANFSPDHPCS